jgi:hypothetical protein
MKDKSILAVDAAQLTSKPSRRTFFLTAGVAAGAAAVVSQTPLGQAVIQEVGSAISPKADGYQLSAHIKKYYETTLI